MRNWPSKKFKYASPKNGCPVPGSTAISSFASKSPIEVGFEQEKRKILGEISIEELRNFDSNTILDNYEYHEVSLGEAGSRSSQLPKTSLIELTKDEKEFLKISEFFYLVSKHYFELFSHGITGPPNSKYSKFGIPETNFGILALKNIGKSLKFSPHVKKYHDFQDEILSNIT